MKTSLVVTVLDEEETILDLLQSILSQTKKPDDLVIVDGGSKDKTVDLINLFCQNHPDLPLTLIKGVNVNRPRGRNMAIAKAKFDTIAVTDAGCILDKFWLKRVTDPLSDPAIDVASGYYKADVKSVFQMCVAVYTLVMSDRVDPHSFLPSARSMALRKSIWREAGGFPEQFPLNEDYVFARKLKGMGKKIKFFKEAVVYFKPRSNLKEAYFMFFRFAKGDASASILRPKVLFIFSRYILGIILIVFVLKNTYSLSIMYYLLSIYIFWTVWKNFKYVRHWQALIYLPLLQFTSDLAVMLGTISAVTSKQYAKS